MQYHVTFTLQYIHIHYLLIPYRIGPLSNSYVLVYAFRLLVALVNELRTLISIQYLVHKMVN